MPTPPPPPSPDVGDIQIARTSPPLSPLFEIRSKIAPWLSHVTNLLRFTEPGFPEHRLHAFPWMCRPYPFHIFPTLCRYLTFAAPVPFPPPLAHPIFLYKTNEKVCLRRNRNMRILRARFSALIPREILNSVQHLTPPNEHQSKAVEARQEIDLRLGSAFTRFQTMRLQVKRRGGGRGC